MNKKERRIWNHSIRFLSVFRNLKYKQIPLAPLLMRDFQRWCRRHYKSLPRAKSMIQNNDIQAACAQYWPTLKTNLRMPKNSSAKATLVRANLYPMIQGKNYVYIAHGRKEYNRCRKFKSCRPLLLLNSMPCHSRYSSRLLMQLSRILRSSKPLPPLFRRPEFQRWLKERLRLAVKQVLQMNQIFTRCDIKRVIYGSTLNRQGALAASVAQHHNIHVTNIQHGVFGVFGHLPVNANLNLVWGPSHKKFLTAHGAPAKRMKLIAPGFHRSGAERIRAYTQKTKSNKRPTVLVALQPLGIRYNRKLISTVERAARMSRNKGQISFRVVYKLHPDQGSGGNIRPKKLSVQSRWIPHRNGKLNHLLDQSHICITPYSTVALEAYFRGVPVLFYGLSRKPYYLKTTPPHFRSTKRCLTLLQRSFVHQDPYSLAVSMLKDPYPQPAREEVPHESATDCDHTRPGGIQSPPEQKQDDAIWQADDCTHPDRCEESEVDREDLGDDR